ncbi:MAG: NAD-dependent epimerase/dehydratase family protein [Gemmatimonadales bacterium]
MRVFLTGASGYIGTAVAERLRAAGHQLTGLARSDASEARLKAAGITPVRGDFTDPKSVGSAARAADGVISLATTYDPKIDGPAVDAILEALAGSNKPFIYTSGIWSHGDTGDKVVDERSPPNPAELVKWRQAVEDRVLAGAGRGIRTVVIRPAIVYGRGGGIPAGFVESARKEGAARYIGSGENRWPLVHVDDLADLYLLALEQAPPGTLLLGVSGRARPVSEIAAAASRGAGADGRTAGTPLEEARKKLGAYADALALDQQASGRKAQELLGWEPRRPDVLEDLERGSYVADTAESVRR